MPNLVQLCEALYYSSSNTDHKVGVLANKSKHQRKLTAFAVEAHLIFIADLTFGTRCMQGHARHKARKTRK